jgi:uncharacterized membrane protein
MFIAAVLISGRDWLIPGIVIFALVLLLLVWSYRRAGLGGGIRALCLSLKLIGVLALAACLLEPLWSRERARPGANYFAILADNSQGMSIKDRGATQSRGEQLQDLLTADKPAWQPVLDESFQLRRYLFDSRLQSTRDFSELAFDGRVSSMTTALRALADRYQGQPLAGVLLFTDGNATDLGEGLADLAGLPPVFPVVMGTDDPVKDVALQRVTVSQTAFEDTPVTIQAEVEATGYSGETLIARLVEVGQPPGLPPATNSTGSAANTVTGTRLPKTLASTNTPPDRQIAEQRQRIGRDSDVASFRFQFKPETAGLSFYRLQVASGEEISALTDPTKSTEATLANNNRVIVVDRGRGPYRILYVAGRPNWEYKFLQRAVLADDQIELVGLLRIARREPKFEFRGRAGESSNPLFRGFGNQSKEEIERYDQPVLIRLNTKDEFELRGGFPKLPEDLYGYHAVILDDLEAEFFTPDQMSLLQKFVSERGAGFLMLGGAESLQQGKYHRTPIGDMLPVYLDQQPAQKPPGELRLAFTREGWLQPWARLRSNEADEKRRLDDVAPFGVINHVRGIKPGASVIATASDDGRTQHPALAVQRFGNGRTAAMMIGDLWHWGLKDEANHRDLDKAWRQLMRWLVADVPGRTDVVAEQKPGDANQAVLLRVRARDKKFLPLDNASVLITVTPVSADGTPSAIVEPGSGSTNATAAVRLTAEVALTQAGVYETTYVPRETGGYRAEAVITDSTGMEVGRAETGWTSDPAADEFRSLKPNRALLETIAKKTGGEIVPAGRLESFAKSLPNRKAPITETWTSPLWHQAGVFLFALACFVAEWGLRRWKGLA